MRDSLRLDRDELMKRLESDGIETRPAFYPMHMLPPYRDQTRLFPVADKLSRRGISLPMHGLLSEDDISYIAERLSRSCKYSDCAQS